MVLLGSACLQNNLINEMYQISSKLGFFCKLRKADTCQDLIGSFEALICLVFEVSDYYVWFVRFGHVCLVWYV